LSRRRVKEKRSGKRGGSAASRSKSVADYDKMGLAPVRNEGAQKEVCGKERKWKRGYSWSKTKTILLEFARARFLTVYLFFFINNRVLGLKFNITLY
jgi:hypothetical protein